MLVILMLSPLLLVHIGKGGDEGPIIYVYALGASDE